MKIEYDEQTDTLYIQFNENPVKRTEPINNIVLVDLDEAGHPIQIEILSASHYGDVSELNYKVLKEALEGE